MVLDNFSELCRFVPAVPHVIVELGGAEQVQGLADETLELLHGPLGGGPQQGLELGERQLKEPAMMPSKVVVGRPGSG